MQEWQPTEGAPAALFATEFLVEARAGGTCVVRIVSSGFGDGEEWEAVRRSLESGWTAYLQNLRVYLTLFAGQRCSPFSVLGHAAGPAGRAWAAAMAALDVEPLAGAPVAPADGAPRLRGVVETVGEGHAILYVAEPAPGMVLVSPCSWADATMTTVQAYLFGEDAAAAAAREEPRWRAWMDERFPTPTA